MKKRVVIFGARGNLGALLTEPVSEMQIVGILDNDTLKQDKAIGNIKNLRSSNVKRTGL